MILACQGESSVTMDLALNCMSLLIFMQNSMCLLRKQAHTTNHQSVGAVERMVQTIKQIMAKNTDEAWLAMLIFRATDIPSLNQSPGAILNGRKYRTGLPVIDVHKKDTEREIEKLSENRSKLTSSSKGKELPKLPVGAEILYEFNPDSDKTKRPK